MNLSTDTSHGAIGVYTPGVYCTAASSAASIGTAGLTLSGSGTFIFRIFGALTSVANSQVVLANGASSCDVFWSPTAATTLGANTRFMGTVIDDAGITVGNMTTWFGRALAFGGTVTTDTATINTACQLGGYPSAKPAATINVVKLVINDGGGTKTIADFPLFVNGTPVVSGVTNTFPAPASVYRVTETGDSNYVRTFSGDCGLNGGFNLNPGDNKFCIVTNDDIGAPIVVAPVPPLIDVVKVPSPLALPNGAGLINYTYTLTNIGTVPVTNITMVGDTCSPIIRASGDTNGDQKLDLKEVWVHTCSTTLTKTHTNTVVTTGWANGISAADITSATVVVGLPVVPPLIHVTKVPSPLTLRAGGGNVIYSYLVTNPGAVALQNVTVSDDKCTTTHGPFGDTNNNAMLDQNESWSYACMMNLTKTTTNTVAATGQANGLTARDVTLATVVVATAVPGLPNTGFAPNGLALFVTVTFATFMLGFIAFVFARKTLMR